MEGTFLQWAVGWLVQLHTILASLLIGSKMADWIGKVGLAPDIEKLRSEIERVKMVVSAVKVGAIRNNLLDESLAHLLYDTDLMLSELDCWRRRGDEMDGHGAPQDADAALPSSSMGKIWTKIWRRFDIKDPSSSTADRDVTPVATGGNSSSRKMKSDDESKHVTAADTNPWNKDEFSNRIQEITRQLQGVRGVLMILGSDDGAKLKHHQRTSSPVQRKLYGMSTGKRSIIKLINNHRSASGVAVLPIVGIAGVGKTALAQHVFSDPSVGSQFDHRIWIPVSDKFDKTRPSKEMLAFVQHQELLKGYIGSKRVLLVLDDVWDDTKDCQWSKLLAAFSSDNAKGNFVLLTTRKPSIAKRNGTARSIVLDGLQMHDFWLLFMACTCGDDKYKGPQDLLKIGEKIASQLKGNPLAAETAGALLSKNRTVTHWSTILKKEDWKQLQLRGGIMPALKLSYDELAYPLQQCFSFCSIFPYGYPFIAEDLVRIWISLGFVKCNHSSQRLEEIGRSYLTDLVNLGFFRLVQMNNQTCYAMSGLMHDFAKLVSRTACATVDNVECNKMLKTIHHLSIVTHSVYHCEDQTRSISRSIRFEEILHNSVQSVRNLRTLVLIGQYDSFFFKAFQDVFQKALNLRLLQMSATRADFDSFVCSLENPTHLRYLKLDCHVGQESSAQVLGPHVWGNLFHLQVFEVGFYRRSGVLFHHVQTVYLEDCAGWHILPSLERLPFLRKLKLSNMQKVREVLVPSLEELILVEMPELETCSCTSVGDLNSSLRVLEIRSCRALKVFDLFDKNHNTEIEKKSWLLGLRTLIVYGCPLLEVPNPLPSSATISALLIQFVATHLEMKGSPQNLDLSGGSYNEMMTLDDEILAFHNLKYLKYLRIDFRNLASISLEGFSQLVYLESLEIKCKKLFSTGHTCQDVISENFIALPSLRSLKIVDCGITGKWLSLMLRHAPILEKLSLRVCPQFTQLLIEEERNSQSNLTPATEASSSGYLHDILTSSDRDGVICIPSNLIFSLKNIGMYQCPHLTYGGSMKGFAGLTSLEELAMQECTKLLSSLVHNGRLLLPESLQQLKIYNYTQQTLQPCFLGDLTCIQKLEVLESPSLQSLQLQCCTSLEDLSIKDCKSLATQLGLQSLVNLRKLEMFNCPSLRPCLGHELCPQLESLVISDSSFLTTSFFKNINCLRSLQLKGLNLNACGLITREQKKAILRHTSLEELQFVGFRGSIPTGHLFSRTPAEACVFIH